MKSSLLSVKGELLSAFSLSDQSWFPVIPISLEFQTPTGWKKELSWLVTAGGGVSFSPGGTEPVLLLDTGLRYNFQPLTLSLRLGGYITPSVLEDFKPNCFDCYLVFFKTAFSIGWKISNKAHIMGTFGIYHAIIPFSGVSVSVPLKVW